MLTLYAQEGSIFSIGDFYLTVYISDVRPLIAFVDTLQSKTLIVMLSDLIMGELMSEGVLLGMGNPLLDISATVKEKSH